MNKNKIENLDVMFCALSPRPLIYERAASQLDKLLSYFRCKSLLLGCAKSKYLPAQDDDDNHKNIIPLSTAFHVHCALNIDISEEREQRTLSEVALRRELNENYALRSEILSALLEARVVVYSNPAISDLAASVRRSGRTVIYSLDHLYTVAAATTALSIAEQTDLIELEFRALTEANFVFVDNSQLGHEASLMLRQPLRTIVLDQDRLIKTVRDLLSAFGSPRRLTSFNELFMSDEIFIMYENNIKMRDSYVKERFRSVTNDITPIEAIVRKYRGATLTGDVRSINRTPLESYFTKCVG